MVRRVLSVLALAAALPSCHEGPKTYESTIQLWRYDVVENGPDGKPVLADVEIEWEKCPGDQMEVVRGGSAFAQCMGKYKVGEIVPAKVLWGWDDRGFYQWDVTQIGDCARPVEEKDPSSFEEIEECEDVTAHGNAVGFTCNRKPYAKLREVCPWMRRK